MNNFSVYLETKFLEWQNQQGKHKSLKEFAEYLEVGRPLLSMWLNGARVPGPRYINRLAQKLGQDVYEILGTKPAPHIVNETQAIYNATPIERLDELDHIFQEFFKDLEKAGFKRTK